MKNKNSKTVKTAKATVKTAKPKRAVMPHDVRCARQKPAAALAHCNRTFQFAKNDDDELIRSAAERSEQVKAYYAAVAEFQKTYPKYADRCPRVDVPAYLKAQAAKRSA